jgi:hypothetical protein
MPERFYWYGRGSAQLRKVDVTVADYQVATVRDRSGTTAPGGFAVVVDHGGYLRVQITLDAVQVADHAELYSMIEHLQSGGAVGFAVDPETVQLGWQLAPAAGLNPGTSVLAMSGTTQMTAWESAGAIASGTKLRLSSPAPACQHEAVTAGGAVSGAGLLTLSTATRSRLAPGYIAVRPWGFHPVLTLDPELGDAAVTSDRELYYGITLTLAEHPAHLAALRGATLGGTTTPHAAPIAQSLLQAIGREARSGTTLGAPTVGASLRRLA